MEDAGEASEVAPPEDVLGFLCDWYRAQCIPELHDGDGISIDAVDGPGWWISIDIYGTSLEGQRVEPYLRDLDDGEWMQVWCDGREFVAAVSVASLTAGIAAFRDFVRDVEARRWARLLAG